MPTYNSLSFVSENQYTPGEEGADATEDGQAKVELDFGEDDRDDERWRLTAGIVIRTGLTTEFNHYCICFRQPAGGGQQYHAFLLTKRQ